MYFPSHSNLKKDIPQELIDGSYDIPGGRFVSFTPKFKYLGTYLSQSLTEDIDINARILAATKNFNALGRSIFRNRKISLDIRSQLYLAITINILLWGCDSWALKRSQLEKISCFHKKCMRQLRQVVNSQAVAHGKCSRGRQTTKRAYGDALRRAGLFDKKGDIKTSEWIECLKAEGTADIIERNLEIEPGSFIKRKKKKEKERKEIEE